MRLVWLSFWRALAQLTRFLATVTVVLLVVAAATAAVTLGTPSGRAWLAGQSLWLANRYTDWHVQAVNIESPGLTHWTVGTLRIFAPGADDSVLSVRGLDIEFPLDQWNNGWRLDRVSAADIRLDIARWQEIRGAAGASASEAETPEDGAGQLTPQNRRYSLGQLSVGQLTLAWSGRTGAALSGALAGQMEWQPGQELPTGYLAWENESDTLAELRLSGNNDNRSVTGQLGLPVDSWAHELTGWPLDEFVRAELEADLQLNPRRLQIHQLETPWMGHQIQLAGDLSETPSGWSLRNGLLTVDDHRSELTAQLAPEATRIQGTVDLPLSVFDPWLPDPIRQHPDYGDDHLTAEIDWPLNDEWEFDGQLETHWHDQDARISLTGRGRNLQISQATGLVVAGNSGLALQGNWHLLDQSGELRLAADIDHTLARAYWQQDWLERLELTGTLTGRGRTPDGGLQWPVWEGEASASGTAPEVAADALPRNTRWQATSLVRWAQPAIEWQGLELTLQHAAEPTFDLTSDGRVNLTEQGLDLDWQFENENIQPWTVQHLPPELKRLNLTAEGTVTGSWTDPEASVTLSGQADWDGEPVELNLTAPRIARDQVLINSLDATWQDSHLEGALTVQPEAGRPWQEWRAQVDLSPIVLSFSDLARRVPDWPSAFSSGRLLSSLSARGALGNPEVIAQSRINADYLGESLTGSVNWQADQVQADFNWQDRYVRLQGEGRPWESGQWQVQAERLRTSDLEPWLDIPENVLELEMMHSLALAIDGGYEALELGVESRNTGQWRGSELTAGIDGNARLERGQLENWQLTNAEVNWRDAKALLSATNRRGDLRPGEARLELTGVPLADLLDRPELAATLNATADLDASWPDWQLRPRLSITGSAFDRDLDARLNATLDGRDGQVERIRFEDLSLSSDDGALLTTQGGLSDGSWDLALDWEGLSWLPAESWPFPSDEWTGAGALTVQGTSADPDISGYMDWQTEWETADAENGQMLTFSTQVGTTEDQQSLTTVLETNNRTLALAGVEWDRQPWHERLETPWMDWDFSAWWEVDSSLEQLVYWFGQDQIQATGELTGDGVISGPLSNPSVDNRLRWQDGVLRLPQTNTELDRLQLDVDMASTDRIQVEGNARSGDGSVDIAGAIGLEDGLAPDLRVRVDNAAVLQRPDIQSAATGELGLSRDDDGFLLGGELRLSGLTVVLNRLSNESVPQLDISNDSANNGGLASSLPLRLDVLLSTDDSASIRGNGLDALLSGELRLTGPVSEISSDGAMVVESGTFNLLTRRFDLVEGELRVVDEAVNVNLLAVHQRGDTEIEARLSGNNEALRLQLQSQPPLPEDEIIAQLLFGKTVQNMTPWQALQLAGAVNQLRGGEGVDLLTATRDSLGLDTLEIEPGDEEGEAQTLRVGRYLNSRVYLEVDTELAEEQDWQGSLEVELTPNLNLETFTGTGGRGGGLELRWRRDY